MRRTLLFLSLCHIILGIICLGAGVAWIILNYVHDSFKDERLPDIVFLVMLPEIVCGFLIFLSGCVGLRVTKKSSCVGMFYVTCNIFNAFVWTPILAAGYTLLVITMHGNAMCFSSRCLPEEWDTYDLEYLLPGAEEDWGYLFPGIGLSVAAIDFVVSFAVILAYCCMRNKEKMNVRDVED